MITKRINVNWKNLLNSWYNPIKDNFLDKEYPYRLLEFLHKEYINKKVYPLKSEIFKCFKLTKYNDVRVVILGQDPHFNNEANGLAFGINDKSNVVPPSLLQIICLMEKDYGMCLNFDHTLENWAKQGVLLFNTSLTVVKKTPKSHSLQWDLFTKKIIKTINDNKNGVIFLLWGKDVQSYASLIDSDKHYILKSEHPKDAFKNNREWDCSHFKEVNNIIEKQNGKEFKIDWK